jgi:hypothetical protein
MKQPMYFIICLDAEVQVCGEGLMALKITYNDYEIGAGNFIHDLLFSRFGTNDCLTGHFELEGLSSFSAI